MCRFTNQHTEKNFDLFYGKCARSTQLAEVVNFKCTKTLKKRVTLSAVSLLRKLNATIEGELKQKAHGDSACSGDILRSWLCVQQLSPPWNLPFSNPAAVADGRSRTGTTEIKTRWAPPIKEHIGKKRLNKSAVDWSITCQSGSLPILRLYMQKVSTNHNWPLCCCCCDRWIPS